MKRLVLIAAALCAAVAADAQSTDVVIMRQRISAPRPKATPTPTPTPKASTSCETMAGNRWTGRFINGNTQYRSHAVAITSRSQITSTCDAMYKQYGVGACFFSANRYADGSDAWPSNVLYYEQYAWADFPNRPELTAANCGQ